MALSNSLYGYVVTHRLVPLPVGNYQTCLSQGILSSPLGRGTLLRSHCGGAWQPSLPRSLRASGCSCPGATAPPRARRCQLRRRTWSCLHGNRLKILLSSSYEIDCWCKDSKFPAFRKFFREFFLKRNLIECKGTYMDRIRESDSIRISPLSFIVIMPVAAIITPPDLMTLFLVTIPLYLLYEVSIRVVGWVEPKIYGVSA